jgi:hypothetical protein
MMASRRLSKLIQTREERSKDTLWITKIRDKDFTSIDATFRQIAGIEFVSVHPLRGLAREF